MLGFLFRGLTAEPQLGAALFDSVTAEARMQHWYLQGQVPDTLDGRFAVVSTLTALALVRFEHEGEAGNRGGVALTERFIEVMESEHRELGIGDPALGKTVRKLVGSLARRTSLWRAAVAGERTWCEATAESLYKASVSADVLRHSADALNGVWSRLRSTNTEALEMGRLA